tara:strand:- start:503 stop:1054 length:552 start_codon:yes stop_codon:yes gene_type:complete
MKQFIFTVLLILTLSIYGQQPAKDYSHRPLSVFNDFGFYANVTSPKVDLDAYLTEHNFKFDPNRSKPDQKTWIYKLDTLKHLYIMRVDCSSDQYAWSEVAADIYLNQLEGYFPVYSHYNSQRNFRKFWLFDVQLPILKYEILVLMVPYGHPIYEKDFSENKRLYKKHIVSGYKQSLKPSGSTN